MNFEWDSSKAELNLRKHGVSFSEAETVFSDDLSATVYDSDHSKNEDRYITIGWSTRRKLLIVSYTERNNHIRIISARELTKAEQKDYEEQTI
jgi:hypothetical protein